MSDFKVNDEVIVYPYEQDFQIYYISMIFDYEVEAYALKLVNGDDTVQKIIHGIGIKHCTPEIKTKYLLGIGLDE